MSLEQPPNNPVFLKEALVYLVLIAVPTHSSPHSAQEGQTHTRVSLLRANSCLHCDLQLRDQKLEFMESVCFMIMTLTVIITEFLMSVTVRNASKSKDKDKGQNLKPLWKAELQ